MSNNTTLYSNYLYEVYQYKIEGAHRGTYVVLRTRVVRSKGKREVLVDLCQLLRTSITITMIIST